MATVLDANCWCLYVDEEINSMDGLGKESYVKAEMSGGLLFDDGCMMRQQYIDMRRPYAEEIFDNWFNDKLVYGAARLVDASEANDANKSLANLKIPRKEHIFMKTALAGRARWLVSLDIDFFEPEAKMKPSKTKQKIISDSSGSVCKHFRKAWGIHVCCPESYVKIAF